MHFPKEDKRMLDSSRYITLVELLLKNGMSPSTNWIKKHSNNTLLLRHDIDFSVDFAYKIAKIEKNIGIFSTYFFMMSSNMYNIFSKKNQDLIKEIVSIGHKVSLHFDPSSYSTLDKFLLEKKTFEGLFSTKVDVVSIHRPGSFLDNNDIALFNVNHTYQNKYFRDMKYLSDSGGRNIFPLIEDYFANKEGKGLHLLTHPIWWINKSKSPTMTLNNWRTSNEQFIISEIRDNCKTYMD